MTFSGVLGTISGLTTCAVMIYKRPNMGNLMCWVTTLVSFGVGIGTYYSVHELLVRYFPHHIVDILEGDHESIKLISTSFKMPTPLQKPPHANYSAHTPSNAQENFNENYQKQQNQYNTRMQQQDYYNDMKQRQSNFIEQQKQMRHDNYIRYGVKF